MTEPWGVAALADEVVREVPGDVVAELVTTMQQGPAAAVRALVRNKVPSVARPTVANFLACGEPPAVLAYVLAGASQVFERISATTDRIEIVWTGMETVAVAKRSTRSVMYELIGSAEEHLTLATYSAGDVTELVKRLYARKQAGVEIRLLLETPRPDGNGGNSVKDFHLLTPYVQALHWRRPRSATYAAMHIKVLIKDRDAALVTSANFSENAMDHSLELGVLITGNGIPPKLREHFDELAQHDSIIPVHP